MRTSALMVEQHSDLTGRFEMFSRLYILAHQFTTDDGDTYWTARCIFCGKDATIFIKSDEEFSEVECCEHFYGMDHTFGPSLIFERPVDNPGARVG